MDVSIAVDGLDGTVCSFCGAPEPSWQWPHRAFTYPVPAGNELVLLAAPANVWRSCHVCMRLSQRGRRSRLLARAVTAQMARAPDLTPRRGQATAEMAGLLREFHAAREGPPVRIPAR